MRSIIFTTLFGISAFTVTTAVAETSLTCPSISSVHQHQHYWPHGEWLPLYPDSGELASKEDIELFRQHATALKQAEWNGDYLEAGHCVYAGFEKVVLARDMLWPNPDSSKNWEYDSAPTAKKPHPSAKCISANENDCPFGGIG